MKRPKVVQFNWRRHWKWKVEPHLHKEAVQRSLDFGMRLYDQSWKRGDAPWVYGAMDFKRRVTGKLSWYQPTGRCHFIAPFALALAVRIYPGFSWTILTSDRHTVPVGYDGHGNPRVVMDILLFDRFTAEQSMAFADPAIPNEEFYKKWWPATRTASGSEVA